MDYPHHPVPAPTGLPHRLPISPGLINSRSNSNSTNINNINNNNINTRTLTHTNPTILDPDPDPSPDTGWDGMGEIDLKEDINGMAFDELDFDTGVL